MDSVFVMTQNPPHKISDKEMILSRPTFLDEIKACQRKRGSSATVGPNYLRAVAEEIGRRYDKFFNPYRNVVPHDFAGRICESDEDVAKTVHEMFQARYPAIYQRYYESILRSRPFTTKVIYFSGSQEDAVVFQKLGIREISIQEVPNHLGEGYTLDAEPESKPVPVKLAEPQPEIKLEPEVQVEQAPSNSETLEELAALAEPVPIEPVAKQETKPESTIQQAKQNHKHQHKNHNRHQARPAQTIKTPDV